MNRSSLLYVFLVASNLELSSADCFLDNKNIEKKSPIVLDVNYKNTNELMKASYFPQGKKITIRENTGVYLACPGSQIVIKGVSQNVNSKAFTCNNGRFNGEFFQDITCTDTPKSVLQKHGSTRFSVNFDVTGHALLEFDGKFNDKLKITEYTNHIITDKINDLVINDARPAFKDTVCPIYNVPCQEVYSFEGQVKTITDLFNNPTEKAQVSTYFKFPGKMLAKGHLVPHRDFNFPYSQRATYYFYNAVPQWQQVNNGNWLRLEKDVRQLAAKSATSLTVYTGTHLISRLFGTELYLYAGGSTRYIPVPRFMWKVVVDPRSQNAVAFVMSNNPNDKVESTSFNCPDVCSKLTYINAAAYNVQGKGYEKGHLYCCEITKSLRDTIKNIPVPPSPLLT